MQNQTKWHNSIRPRRQKLTLTRISSCENSIFRFIFTRICVIPQFMNPRANGTGKYQYVSPTYSDDSELSLRTQVFLRHKAQCTEGHGERTKDLKRKQCTRVRDIFSQVM